MTANDMEEWQLPINGYPTLVYFAAGEKSNYRVYEGPRYEEDILDYIR
jgi:hypothetical protein